MLRSSVLVALLALALIPALAHGASAPTDPDPLGGRQLFTDCQAAHESRAKLSNPWWWANHSKGRQKKLYRRIARVPTAKWLTGNGIRPTPRKALVRFLARVDDPQWGGPNCRTPLGEGRRGAYVGSYPVIVVRALKYSGCKGYDGGGAWGKSGPRSPYRKWIDSFAYWLGLTWTGPVRYTYKDRVAFPRPYFSPTLRQAAVILEPEALGDMGKRSGCLTHAARRARLANLKYAATKLGALGPGVATYIDAGASDWLTSKEAVRMLRAAGIAHVRGFALNSTHFNSTGQELAYGNKLARRLGTHFVVNTAENGRGALKKRYWGKAKAKSKWCNPRNSGLGAMPTTRTGSRYADAFLWISRPGLSNNTPFGRGRCGKGPLQQVWWKPRALSEAARAKVAKPPWPAPALPLAPAHSTRR